MTDSDPLKTTGRAWVFGDNVNTDVMMPGAISMGGSDEDRMRNMFRAVRTDFADNVKSGDLLVGGTNFGTGSSRPVQKFLKMMGVAGVLGESINALFFRNSINEGVPIMEYPGIKLEVSDGDLLSVDFTTGEIQNLTRDVTLTPGQPLPEFLREIVERGGMIPRLRAMGLVEAEIR